MFVCSAYLMHLNFAANTKRKCLLPFHFASNPRRKVASSIIAMKGNPAMFWHTMLLITWLRSNPSSPSQIPQCALVTVTATRGSSRLLCGAPAPDRAPVRASDWFLSPATGLGPPRHTELSLAQTFLVSGHCSLIVTQC